MAFDEKKLKQILFAEFFGSFLLAISSTFAGLNEHDSRCTKFLKSLSIIFLAIFLNRKISGPSLNPGTYIMGWALKKQKFQKKYFPHFLITQIISASIGYCFVYTITRGKIKHVSIADDNQIINACIGEFIGSFLFYLVILICIDPENDYGKDDFRFTFVITNSIGCGYAIAGHLSHASMNPANAMGNCIVWYFITGDIKKFRYMWIYIIFPILLLIMERLV